VKEIAEIDQVSRRLLGEEFGCADEITQTNETVGKRL
jgi:hypothetical protein